MCNCKASDLSSTLPPLAIPAKARKTADTVTIYTDESGKPSLLEFRSLDGDQDALEYVEVV